MARLGSDKPLPTDILFGSVFDIAYRPKGNEAGRQKMDPPMHPLPAEEHDAEEPRLQEEGGHDLEGKQWGKGIADGL